MEIVVYWSSLLLLAAAVLFPGALLARLLFRNWSPEEHIALGPILGVPITVAAWLVIAPLSSIAWSVVLFSVVLLTPYLFFRSRAYRASGVLFLLCVGLAHVVMVGLLQMHWDAPTYTGGDFFLYTFKVPWQFLSEGSLAGDRPALMSLYATGMVEAFGGDFSSQWLFQNAFVSGNALIIGPALLIARRCGGPRTAGIAAVMLLLNPFVLHQTMYAWPKNIAAVGVLASLYLLFLRDDRRSAGAAGWIAAIAYFCHQVVGLLILPLGLVWFVGRRVPDRWIRALVVVATGLCGWGLYVLWATQNAYDPTSRHLMCFLTTDWWQEVYDRDPVDLWEQLKVTPLVDIIWPRIRSLIATFTPVFSMEAYHEFQCLPAATGLAAFVACIWAVGAGVRRRTHRIGAMALGLFLGVVTLAAFAGCFSGLAGLAGSGLQAVVPFILVMAALFVAKTENFWPWLSVIVVEMVWSAYWWIHRYLYILTEHRLQGDPNEDDYLERDLSVIESLEPGDMTFADDFVQGSVWLGWIVGTALLLLLVGFAWRQGRRLGLQGEGSDNGQPQGGEATSQGSSD